MGCGVGDPPNAKTIKKKKKKFVYIKPNSVPTPSVSGLGLKQKCFLHFDKNSKFLCEIFRDSCLNITLFTQIFAKSSNLSVIKKMFAKNNSNFCENSLFFILLYAFPSLANNFAKLSLHLNICYKMVPLIHI
jgi:hypothetical protein